MATPYVPGSVHQPTASGGFDWASIFAANQAGQLSSFLYPSQQQVATSQQSQAAAQQAAQQAAAQQAAAAQAAAAAQQAQRQREASQALAEAQRQQAAAQARQQELFDAALRDSQQAAASFQGGLGNLEDVFTQSRSGDQSNLQGVQGRVGETASRVAPAVATTSSTKPTIIGGSFGKYIPQVGGALPSFGKPLNSWSPLAGAGTLGAYGAGNRAGFQSQFGGTRVPLGQIRAAQPGAIATAGFSSRRL